MRQMPLLVAALALLAFASPSRADSSLTLESCIAAALRTVPKLAEAGAAFDLTTAQQREIAAGLYPSLRSDVQYLQEPGYREVITNRGLSTVQMVADYLVFDGGRRVARIHAARYAEQSAKLGLDAARSQVVLDTTVAFYTLIHADQVLDQFRANAARLERYESAISTVRQLGRATANDVLRINVLSHDSRVQLNTAVHDRARASLILGALIGEYGREDLVVEAPRGDAFVKPDAGEIDSNPSLQSLQRNYAGAAEELRAARAERYPTFSLQLTAGALGTDPPSTVSRYWGASYGGAISMPLYTGGAIGARIDQAEARVRQAKAQTDQARIDLAQRLAEARSRYDEAIQSIALLQETFPSADASFQLSWSRFLGGGNITLLEVTDSYSQALAVHLNLADQQLAAHEAAAEIAQLTGTNLRQTDSQ